MPNQKTSHLVLPAHFAGLDLVNAYAQLPQQFFSEVRPTPVSRPSLIALNNTLAEELNLDCEALASAEGVALLAGNALPDGARPIAQAYAGHQFGYFNPQLGDGRAILLGDVKDRNGQYRDIQLKGAGPTPYSRSGDGRAALGPVIREYMLSEAMHRLGIKTTRALAAIKTGETVYRQTALPGAIITRVAASHVRIGTFEYFFGHRDKQAVQQLADFVIARHYPAAAETANPYLALLDCVIAAQASLVAQWLQIGFIHGVMNTDNMSISGETIDYGPCAFMDRYDPETVFSSIDQNGRYAFANQGSIAMWNLTRLAECLLPLLHEDQDKAVTIAQDALGRFGNTFDPQWLHGMGRKLGFSSAHEQDENLVGELLQLLHRYQVDYTQSFRLLATALPSTDQQQPNLWLDLFKPQANEVPPEDVQAWLSAWHNRLQHETKDTAAIAASMNAVNPVYIPRNHRVEAVISAAVEQDDLSPMQEMMQVLSEPYTEQPGMEKYGQPAPASEERYRTFCGT